MPCGSTNRKPVSRITDRAKRYRANRPACVPNGPRQCALCRSRRNLVVDHKDGNESNGAKRNLRWLCKVHNSVQGFAMRRQKRGVRTRQYNPGIFDVMSGLELLDQVAAATKPKRKKKQNPVGAPNLAAYLQALAVLQGEAAGNFQAARRLIHNTPADDRSAFAREVWRRRRAHGTDYYGAVPF